MSETKIDDRNRLTPDAATADTGTLNMSNVAIEVRNISDIPKEWGKPVILIPQHPVKFSEPPEGYEYYGRKAEIGVDMVAMRWQGSDSFKNASPVKITEIAETYEPIKPEVARKLGLSSSEGIMIKTEPTVVYLVPEGRAVNVFSREGSVEKIEGGKTFGIAVDTAGFPYKFPIEKNTKESGNLPAAYTIQE